MTSIENSEFDFSELDLMDEDELKIFFSILTKVIQDFRASLEDQEFIDSLVEEDIIKLKDYYDKIFELFLEWDLVDYEEDITTILVDLDILLEK